MIRRLTGAVQFLTVLPISASTSASGEAAIFFPLVGALLGAAGGALFLVAQRVFDSSIAALIAIAGLISLTGALHEDGLADAADAFRSGRSREKILAIMKDSRIGVYGALALIVSVALRWQSLMRLQVHVIAGLVAALALSRSALVLLAFFTPSIGEGLGASFASFLSVKTVTAVLAQALVFALPCRWRGILMLLTSALTIALARFYFLRRLGGVNGDCLGATCQVVETVNLMVLAWRHFS